MPPVIPALREVLREAREDAELTFAQIAHFTSKGETVFRRLENGSASPRISEIDVYVSAYAQAAKTSALSLWQRATERAADATLDEIESKLNRLDPADARGQLEERRGAGERRTSTPS